MPDAHALLAGLRRPGLLVRAAHLGLQDYRREHNLPRLLPEAHAGAGRQIFDSLLAAEDRLDAERREGAATYSIARHIETLSALIVEARLLGSRPA